MVGLGTNNAAKAPTGSKGAVGGSGKFRLCRRAPGGASPYPKSVIGNDEGGFARTWRTKTYSGRERGGEQNLL